MVDKEEESVDMQEGEVTTIAGKLLNNLSCLDTRS